MDAVIKLSSPATREFWEIPVLFEDDHLMVLDKPSGLLTSPDRHDPERPSLMRLLHTAIAEGKPWARQRAVSYLMNAQRLDREASGVLVLARSKPVLVQLANLFSAGHPVRTYVGLAEGGTPQESFEVDAPLGPHPTRAGVVRVDRRHGKKARTLFEVAERFDGFTLLRCRPVVERSHQVRVHLQWARLPLAGDALYGGAPLRLSRLKPAYRLKEGRTERPLLATAALHAERLELTHPVTGAPINVTAPWPKDLRVALKYLQLHAPWVAPSAPAGAPPA